MVRAAQMSFFCIGYTYSGHAQTASIIDPNSNWIQDNNTDPDYHYTPANETHLLLAWIASVFYFSCVSASKLSILMLYDRLFSASRAFHLQVIVLNTVVVLFWIATTFGLYNNFYLVPIVLPPPPSLLFYPPLSRG